jgi:GH25 family lysozyme M1 (1,4-beta-N-acetylmuramidase)
MEDFMIKLNLAKTIAGLAIGLAISSCFGGVNHAAYAAETSSITTTSTKDEVMEVVDEGNFDYTQLSKDENKHVYSLFGDDPETIRALQRQSDSVSAESSPSLASSYSASLATTYSHASMFKGYTILDGIDVSTWNGDINWKKVKAAGIDYAIIRVGGRYTSSGGYFTDSKYEQNLKGAIAAGIDVGVYFFSTAINTTEAKQEAAYVMSLISGYNINLPIVMDYEYATGPSGRLYNAHLSKAAATNVVKAFCRTVEAKGYVGMIYASKSVLVSDMNASSIAKSYPVWNAQYNISDTLTTKHSYWQYSSSGNVSGIDHATDTNFRYISKPVAVASLAQKSSTDATITLSWSKIPEVYGYQIFRYDSSQDKYVSVGTAKGASTTSFTDTGLADGKQYTYKVRGYYKLNSGNVYGASSAATTGVTIADTVENFKAKATSSGQVTLSWSTISAATGYRIYRYDASTKSYVKLDTVRSGDISSYTDTTTLYGTTYKYKIRAYTNTDTGIVWHVISDPISVTTVPGTVSGLSVSSASSTSLKLKWNAQENVSGYIIYVWDKELAVWSKIGKVTKAATNTYTIEKLTPQTQYSYSITAYYKSGSSYKYTGRSDAVTAYTGPAAPAKVIVKERNTSSLKIAWSNVSNATGYMVYLYNETSKKYERVATIKDPTQRVFTITGLKSTSSYTIAVKAYITSEGVTGYGDVAKLKTCTKPVTIASSFKYKALGSSICLKWSKVKGASGYLIYKYNKTTGKSTLVKKLADESITSYVGAKLASNYSYQIRVYKKYNGHTYYGDLSAKPKKASFTVYGVVNTASVRVRSGASTSTNIIKELSKGRKVKVTGVKKVSGKYWYKVSFTSGGKKYTGYMSADYVTLR